MTKKYIGVLHYADLYNIIITSVQVILVDETVFNANFTSKVDIHLSSHGTLSQFSVVTIPTSKPSKADLARNDSPLSASARDLPQIP
jgi:hypothetical protein